MASCARFSAALLRRAAAPSHLAAAALATAGGRAAQAAGWTHVESGRHVTAMLSKANLLRDTALPTSLHNMVTVSPGPRRELSTESGTSALNTGDFTPGMQQWVMSMMKSLSAAGEAKDAAFAAALSAKDAAFATALSAKDEVIAIAPEGQKSVLAVQLKERKAKDAALKAADVARAEERKAKDAAHKLEMQLRDVEPRQERLFVRFAFEHVANLVRLEKQNQQLTLKDALLTFAHKTDAEQDRIFQKVREWYPPSQHKAVYAAYALLVDAVHLSHHDVLQELLVKHPEGVFHNNLQRLSFRAVCELNDVALPPPLSDKSA